MHNNQNAAAIQEFQLNCDNFFQTNLSNFRDEYYQTINRKQKATRGYLGKHPSSPQYIAADVKNEVVKIRTQDACFGR
jgi:hypothetical protein